MADMVYFKYSAAYKVGMGVTMHIRSTLLGLLSLLLVFILPASHAYAAGCSKTNMRWASSSNTLYITGAGVVCSPADISAAFPQQMVNVSSGIYLLKANLILQTGAGLEVDGMSLPGGTTNDLRLLSNNTSASTSVVFIRADYGTIGLKSTKVTSWNEAANGPDTEYASLKRAYIQVRSRLVSGTAQTSRMDIVSSDIGYLGYNASETYGLSWKVEGSAFASVDVLGDVTGSHVHSNYFGMYTFGAFGMNINNNEFDHNIKYGIDTHDDSDNLGITNNRSHDNGDHGIICSQRCDHLTITGNTSFNNVGHGIMLHRSTDFSLVENNTVNNNTDSGIALFESNNNTIRSNHVEANKNGIRLSVGSSFNTITNNVVLNQTDTGIYTYKGTDAPARPGNDGINRSNTWKSNGVAGSRNYVLKLNATDGDNFTGNDFRNNPGAKYALTGATNTTYSGNLTDPGVVLP